MKPTQLINAHIDLKERLDTEWFMLWLWTSVNEVDGPNWPALGPVTHRAVKEAALYRVSDDVSTIIQASAAGFDASDVWDATRAPTPCGLARFDKPIPLTNLQGVQNKVHWILWGPVPGGTMLFMFNDHADPDEMAEQYLQSTHPNIIRNLARVGPWGAVAGMVIQNGQALGEHLLTPSSDHIADAALNGSPVFDSSNAARFVHALWLMTDQAFTEVALEKPGPVLKKEARRRGLRARISVIQLWNKNTERQPGESTVQYSCRWLTRGHWRWHRHGPGLTLTKRILILPHVKGPADKPLVISKKVYDI